MIFPRQKECWDLHTSRKGTLDSFEPTLPHNYSIVHEPLKNVSIVFPLELNIFLIIELKNLMLKSFFSIHTFKRWNFKHFLSEVDEDIPILLIEFLSIYYFLDSLIFILNEIRKTPWPTQ